MTVSCQEAMVEAQASDRIVMPANGASTATIESLRARLLSERAASKEARQQAHSIAQKVSELQSRLDAEIEYRKKAEVAMTEVLKALKAKGLAMEGVMIDAYLSSESSASGNGAPTRGSKGGDLDHSSGEEGSRAEAQDECHGSANSQDTVDDAGLSEDSVFEHREGQTSEDSFSGKTQINSGDNSQSDYTERENGVVNKDEDGFIGEQAMSSEPLEGHLNVSLMSTEGGEKHGIEQLSEALNDAVKSTKEEVNTQCNEEEGVIEQSSELPCDTVNYVDGEVKSQGRGHSVVKYVEGEVNTQSSSGEDDSSSANDSSCPPVAEQVNVHEKVGTLDTSSENLSGGQQVNDHTHGVPSLSNVKTAYNVPVPERETFLRPRFQDVHPYFFSNGYAYSMPHTYAEKLPNVSSAEAPSLKGPMSFFNTACHHAEPLTSKVAEYGRYPQAPISDDVLSLVDDKSGKLGSILTALQLAKQQLSDEEQPSLYMGEKFEPPSPIPYPGFYEGVPPYQPPYRPWKPERYNAAPIIHFPMSPSSDHEASPFEKQEGFRRSSSTSAYYMPGYDPYLQPRGEVHLGNGITLYTD